MKVYIPLALSDAYDDDMILVCSHMRRLVIPLFIQEYIVIVNQ